MSRRPRTRSGRSELTALQGARKGERHRHPIAGWETPAPARPHGGFAHLRFPFHDQPLGLGPVTGMLPTRFTVVSTFLGSTSERGASGRQRAAMPTTGT